MFPELTVYAMEPYKNILRTFAASNRPKNKKPNLPAGNRPIPARFSAAVAA